MKISTNFKRANLTQREMSCRPANVQFGIQFVVLAVHFESFRVEVHGVKVFVFLKVVVTFIVVYFRYC